MTAVQKRCQELWCLFAPQLARGRAPARKTISRKRFAATEAMTMQRDPRNKLVGMAVAIFERRVLDFD
jgi:hypothetical protein